MDIIPTIKDLISKSVQDLGLGVVEINLEHPTELKHGDFSTNVAMQLAKDAGRNPHKLASEIVTIVSKNLPDFLNRVEVAGPGFINLRLSPWYFSDVVQEIISRPDKFGKSEILYGKKWVIEHTSPNPNKAMHLGHLRNNLVGMSVARLAQWNGAEVIYDAIDNNRGIAIAKLMWGYLKFARIDGDTTKNDLSYWFSHQDEWQTPEVAGQDPDRFMDSLYVKGSNDFKDDEQVEKIVRGIVVSWETEDKETWALWQKVLDYVYAGQRRTLDRLGSHWDKVWHEHELYKEGKDLVKEGLEKGIFRKLEDGAVLTDLEEKYGIPDTILMKSDGTALYITQDLALTKHKRDFYQADKLFWVIGPEQSLALKQMFACCEQLGIGNVQDYTHLSYGYVSIKGQGKMSSRAGTVVYIDDLLNEAKKEVGEKLAGEDSLSQDDKESLAEMVGMGAVKYSFLKSARNTDMEFDMQSSIDAEGDSGPYLQYTYARIQSILRKAAEAEIGLSANFPNNWDITDIERLLYRFPEVINRALFEYAPHHVATYLIELARAFNSFYGSQQIVQLNDDASGYRVALTQSVGIVLKNGLDVLGISAPDRM